mgnify:CR=1 FL=1
MATNLAQERLGDLFVRERLISEEQLQQGLAEAKKEGTRLGFALVKLGFVAEEELTRMLAKQYRVPAVDLSKVTVDQKILKLVPGEIDAPDPNALIHLGLTFAEALISVVAVLAMVLSTRRTMTWTTIRTRNAFPA